MHIHRKIREPVGSVNHALDGAGVNPVLDRHSFERRTHKDGLTYHAVLPSGDRAVSRESHLHTVQHQRPIESALNIVVASPQKVNRSAAFDSLCDLGDLDHPVRHGIAAAAETAATEQGVDLDLLGFEAKHLRRHQLIDTLQLTSRPQLRAFVVNFEGTIQRLHGSVREIG